MSGSSKDYDVVVVGSIMTDLITYAERLPKPGETILGKDFKVGFGGKGANQAVQSSMLGSKVAFVGAVGSDTFGHDTLTNFSKRNIDAQNVQVFPGSSGMATIIVADCGENEIIIVPGSNSLLSVDNCITRAKSLIINSKVLVCQLEIPLEVTIEALVLAKSVNTFTILNIAPAIANFPERLIDVVDILCLNETESSLLASDVEVTDVESAKKAAHILLQQTGAKCILITLGKDGCVALTGSCSTPIHVTPDTLTEKVVDTTGAGDSFIGTLAHLLAKHECEDSPLTVQNLTKYLKVSCDVASISVCSSGTQSSYPSKECLTTRNIIV